MLIYGNTPSDILHMIWRRKWHLLSLVGVVLLLMVLLGCSTKPNSGTELNALDKFWRVLGGDTNSIEKVE